MFAKNLLESIRVVRESERKAAEYYAEAAKNTGDPMNRELLEQLSDFEQFHYAHLTKLVEQLETSGDFIEYEGREFPAPAEIVPKAVEDPNQQMSMNIISRALELEKQAEQAYAGIAERITDPQGRAMFRRLSQEEHNHYRLLNLAGLELVFGRIWMARRYIQMDQSDI
jgi:rubrerythrin